MKAQFIRKEVSLSKNTVKHLEDLAKNEDRTVKKYMEIVLTKHAFAASQHLPIDISKIK